MNFRGVILPLIAATIFSCYPASAIDLSHGHTPRSAPQSKANPGVLRPPTGQMENTAVELTKAECRGLGGQIVYQHYCENAEQCATVDRNGVVHLACITEFEDDE